MEATMKLGDIIEECLDQPNVTVNIVMPNGDKVPVKSFGFDYNKKGEYIFVLNSGKKLGK